MNSRDHVGTRQHEHVVVAAKVVGMRSEPIAAEVGLGQAMPLHHGAHRTVEDEQALGEQAVERVTCRHE